MHDVCTHVHGSYRSMELGSDTTLQVDSITGCLHINWLLCKRSKRIEWRTS
jgi:hypothetical protein